MIKHKRKTVIKTAITEPNELKTAITEPMG